MCLMGPHSNANAIIAVECISQTIQQLLSVYISLTILHLLIPGQLGCVGSLACFSTSSCSYSTVASMYWSFGFRFELS